MKTLRKTLLSASIGNMLEFYSFTLFGLFLPVISPLFFPEKDPVASLLYGYIFFAVGFFAYPLGALLFGHIGDRVGRKKALSLAICIMAFPTALIGMLPSYSYLGIFSPILLFICRLLQGICAGGEYNGAGIFIIEHAGKNKEGFSGAFVAAAGTFGAFFATIIGFIFTVPGMPEWAWRIPFFLGSFIGFVGFYIRRELKESPEFLKDNEFSKKISPFVEIVKHHYKAFICAVGIGALGTVPFYMVIGYLNTYFVTIEKINLFEMMALNMGLTFFCAITLPFIGSMADSIGHARIMIISSLVLLCYSFLFFLLLQEKSIFIIAIAEAFLLGLSQGYVAPLNAFVSKLFPVSVRYSGTSLGYCVGMALFGGTTPYISSILIEYTHNPIAPAFYLIFVCLLGIISVSMSSYYLKTKILFSNETSLS